MNVLLSNKRVLIGLVFGLVLSGWFWLNDDSADELREMTSESINSEFIKTEVGYWVDVIDTVGGFEAYKLFGQTFATEDDHYQHTQAHVFGESLYKAMGVDGVAVCDSNFGFGCYHSFFGWALLDNGLGIINRLDEACIEVYGTKGLGCQHGIGHGVIAELGYDQLESALEACATLTWKEPIGGCSSGVYMEYNFFTMGDSSMRSVEEGGPHYPCSDLLAKFQPGCYFEQPAWWMAYTSKDFVYVGERCAEVADLVNRRACYRGTGNAAAGSLLYDIPKIQAACADMNDAEGAMLCTEGATWIIAAQPEFKDVWMQLCEPLDGSYRERCIESRNFI